MPGIRALTLQEISDAFPNNEKWWFESSSGLKQVWWCEKEPYTRFFFHINEFSELTAPATIQDLVAAADVSRNFGLSI